MVATVTAEDDGGAAGLRYFMTDGTFEIDAVTGEIKVRNGAVLDYESTSSYSVIRDGERPGRRRAVVNRRSSRSR